MTERLFFAHTVEAMFRYAFPPERYDGLTAALEREGVDLTRPLLPAYKYDVWRRCLEVQRQYVFPSEPLDAASYEQGARYVEAYFERTALGGPLKLLLRAIGPRRTLQRLTLNFRSANTFSDVVMTSTGSTQARLEVNDVFSASPHYIVGMLERGLALIGSACTVRLVSQRGDACDFDAQWS